MLYQTTPSLKRSFKCVFPPLFLPYCFIVNGEQVYLDTLKEYRNQVIPSRYSLKVKSLTRAAVLKNFTLTNEQLNQRVLSKAQAMPHALTPKEMLVLKDTLDTAIQKAREEEDYNQLELLQKQKDALEYTTGTVSNSSISCFDFLSIKTFFYL